jgi:predicted phosphodiesterase
MRVAVVSDIHGNLSAFEAVLADLRQTSPDLILHGGDIAHGGASPAETLDLIRDLGWPGVLGNADEMLFDLASLTAFASRSPQLASMFAAIDEMAAATRERLGEGRTAWLSALPRVRLEGQLALVHASPDSTWISPRADASDAELQSVYAALGRPIVIFGHIHKPFIRTLPGLTVINSGSVSLSYDGDPRASYLLLDDGEPTIRRVEYDVEREARALAASGLPHAAWTIRMLRAAAPVMP